MKSSYDVVLIHPPAVYDFRKKPLFPGALGPSVAMVQFVKVPIGMLSLAEYIDRHGYRVILDNLGDRMTTIPNFNVEVHLKDISAPIIAVGLHFQQHAQGAMEIARLVKQFHPHSLVVMGGLTATCFHEEIIQKYQFVDAVVRGEAEKAFLALTRVMEKDQDLSKVPNLTYRSPEGKVCVTPMLPASESIDEFEYTRFDLIEPKTSIYPVDSIHRYSLEVCRGCAYNCSICGGSSYAYKKYLGMKKPAFRSPAKIVADMKKLNDQGIFFIGLFQDMRMAGKKYWQELIATIIKEKPVVERLSLDILVPCDEEFIQAVAGIGRQVIFHLCPDTGSDKVRKRLGRHYSNEKILETIKTCHKYRVPVTNFFSVGLAGETESEMKETWAMWEKLNELEREVAKQNSYGDIDQNVPIGGSILGPIVLDPGSMAFDTPEKYGYRLLYQNLDEYIDGLSKPSWNHWINYETDLLDKKTIIDMIHRSTEFTIYQREKYGFYTAPQANFERNRLEADRIILAEMENLMALPEGERNFRLIAIRRNLDAFLG